MESNAVEVSQPGCGASRPPAGDRHGARPRLPARRAVRTLGLRARVVVAAGVAIVVAVLVRRPRGAQAARRPAARARWTTRSAPAPSEVARLAASSPRLLTEPGALEGRLSGGSLLVQVVDRRGRIVARSSALGAPGAPAGGRRAGARSRDRRPGYADARLGTEPIRDVRRAARRARLQPGRRAAPCSSRARRPRSEQTLSETRRLVAAHRARSPPCSAPSSPRCWPAARCCPLTPPVLRRARDRANQRRLAAPAGQAHDEVGTLAEDLNAMLASLRPAHEAEQRLPWRRLAAELRHPTNRAARRPHPRHPPRHRPGARGIEADAARLGVLLDDLLALAREDAAAPARGRARGPPRASRARRRPTTSAAGETGGGMVVGERPCARARGRRPHAQRAGSTGRATVGRSPSSTTTTRGLSVSDDGPGLEPRAGRARLRALLAQRARRRELGLGLAIVEAIAERHGGTAGVSGSRVGVIDLPASHGSLKP